MWSFSPASSGCLTVGGAGFSNWDVANHADIGLAWEVLEVPRCTEGGFGPTAIGGCSLIASEGEVFGFLVSPSFLFGGMASPTIFDGTSGWWTYPSGPFHPGAWEIRALKRDSHLTIEVVPEGVVTFTDGRIPAWGPLLAYWCSLNSR